MHELVTHKKRSYKTSSLLFSTYAQTRAVGSVSKRISSRGAKLCVARRRRSAMTLHFLAVCELLEPEKDVYIRMNMLLLADG